MRSFGAAALFILAVITECLCAQERSRQRSGPIRSVPVAADIKRDVEFDCPEEFGYYPHPTDCSLYYVCVFGGALLESCTGGLMYSHELQTCDWPRNVGCDGTSGSAGNEDIERINEREPSPPPPPPRRTPSAPPPLPRVQPNPIVTSRGQPKFNREDYEKQQQLYAEVDDLPPVEEIENDRQQRVYRGQPSTIGQVQKDRDGYGSQVVNSRTLNSNIIPASIPQTAGKFGSFSFGTQVEDRRSTATPAPQSYSDDKIDEITDSSHDRHADIQMNEIVVLHTNKIPLSRNKREVTEIPTQKQGNNNTYRDDVSDRSDIEVMEYFENENDNPDVNEGETDLEDTERGKRQIRYILKNNYKNPLNVWTNPKPIKFVDNQPYKNYNSNSQIYQSTNTGANKNSYYDVTRRPYANNQYSSANPFSSYQKDNYQSQRPFIPSFPDLFHQKPPEHTPMNVATQIITKSPPISALKSNENPFSALSGGFFNNNPSQSTSQHKQNFNQFYQTSSAINHYQPSQDSSLLPTTLVTGKPIKMATLPQQRTKYKIHPVQNLDNNNQAQQEYRKTPQNHVPSKNQDVRRPSYSEEQYDDEEDEDDEEDDDNNNSDERDEEDDFYKHSFPKPPYEFSHPSHKYADIENPFANPNFDFDAFLSKLRNDHDKTVVSTTTNPKVVQHQNIAVKIINPSTESNSNSGLRSSSLSYDGMSTPRPFTNPTGPNGATIPFNDNVNTLPTTKQPESFQKIVNLQNLNHQPFAQHQSKDENTYNRYTQQNDGIPTDVVRPKLKPPNFNDDRQLPISYSFNRPISSTTKTSYDKTKGETKQVLTATQKPYFYITSTGTPMIVSSPKQQFYIKPEKVITLQPHMGKTGKQYFTISSGNPYNGYITIQQSTERPLTTIANEQLSALQQFWKKLSTMPPSHIKPSVRPNSVSEMPNLESLFEQAIRSTLQTPIKQVVTTTTTVKPAKRRPIPKPSPEMNDYYYDDDEELYEPPVKSKYMPSTEVKPQRPPMAQNYKEYDEDNDSEDSPVNNKPLRNSYSRPASHRPEIITKNYNDVSVVTKTPTKESNKYVHGKPGVSVMLSYVPPAPNVLMRPEVTNYEIHHSHRNRTMFIRRPSPIGNGPYTVKPPKYLNQTTLRPYTVRHRLAKPTTVTVSSTESGDKTTRGRVRHHNIVAQMKLTTPRDSHNQETRYTKTRHDDKSNSLKPTESVTPPTYSANPRPKMLYNGTQSYTPDQYDPYYAVYDEDGELYKDTDYVQQYNTASLRPAVQQTYRGTPPPARRPVEIYTPRPTQEDYDDALIHGQINNQNQYQSPIRHSTRGEGNELGYDHNPSSVKTTIYEAPTISTTPSTTSTSTTTQRPTSAPITEAMTPSRFTQRSSTDENPNDFPESSSKSPLDGFAFSFPATSSPIINFSSLAKPFEQTDNSNRLKETLPTTEKFLNSRLPGRVTNINKPPEVVRTTSDDLKRKVVSLTTGFSIRRNSNNTNNPYTLTVLTRPFESYDQSWKVDNSGFNNKKKIISNILYSNNDSKEDQEQSGILKSDASLMDRHSSEDMMRRSDSSSETVSKEDIKPLYMTSSSLIQKVKTRITEAPTSATIPTKYYLKTVIKRPAPFSVNDEPHEDSTENVINTEELIEAGLQNARANEKSNVQYNDSTNNDFAKRVLPNRADLHSIRSSYRSLDSYNYYNHEQNDFPNHTTSSPSTSTTAAKIATFASRGIVRSNKKNEKSSSSKPTYFSYRVLDDEISEQTTEIFSTSVKNIIKAFFNNLATSPNVQRVESSTVPFRTTTEPEEKTVNIGFKRRPVTYPDEKPLRSYEKRLQIINNPNMNTYPTPTDQHPVDNDRRNEFDSDFSSTATPTTSTTEIQIKNSNPQILAINHENQRKKFLIFPTRETFVSKFNDLVTSRPETEDSQKFHKLVAETPSVVSSHLNDESDNEITKSSKTDIITTITSNESEWNRPISKTANEIATTTSTTKSTVTVKIDSTATTKSMSFPTRPSRVNPAIKLAATNPGGGRRSYQSSSKCSSDNSLQQNPKCNEIKYQRPSNTRGRGSAHYSTLSGDPPQQPQQPNRGTPPTRSRPTLKPSTVIVTNPNPVVDIYAHPPRRPAPVYPQPTPDKTAAKCRKDVCLLPDCYCGGKDIPGDLPVESVPQLVLLTFDDSVNDLNKGLYADLFEKGRVNPNGCPISATFYVSHEWTDYSQVQNLYAAGHEMASHTVSHSFGEQFSQKKWNREVAGQREILAAYGGVKLEDVRGMRAPFLSVGGNKMFKMLYDSNFTYDSSLPVYENRPPSWPYTLDYKLFHDCMIPPCPTKSYPGVWEVPMVMWQDLNGGRCSMGDACANPPEAEGVYKMLLKNFDRHYTSNRAPFGLFYHAAWFTQPHHKEGFIMFLDFINQMNDVWIVTNWQALQWVRDPTPISRLNNFQPFQCNYQDRPKKCNNPKVCNLWHKSGVRYMRTCQPCPEIYPWTGKTGIKSSRIDNDIEE